jgi:hypothetical protein
MRRPVVKVFSSEVDAGSREPKVRAKRMAASADTRKNKKFEPRSD